MSNQPQGRTVNTLYCDGFRKKYGDVVLSAFLDRDELTNIVTTTDIAAMLLWSKEGRAIADNPSKFNQFLDDIGIMEDDDRAAARWDRERIRPQSPTTTEGQIIDLSPSPQRLLSKK